MTRLTVAGMALIILGFSLAASAEDMPSTFVHQYTDDVQIVLQPEPCDASNVKKGWAAYAENEKGERAAGCWIRGMQVPNMPPVVEIHLELDGNFIDYTLYQDKFEAKY